MRKRHTTYSDEAIAEAVASSVSQSAAMRKLGMSVTGSQHRHLSGRIKRLGLDTSHYKHSSTGMIPKNKMTPDEILVRIDPSSTRTEASRLRWALSEIGVPYKCVGRKCRVGEQWLGTRIVLQVDHIDGDGWNNQRENLRFLCPNCHSQTDNFAGNKNKPLPKVKKRPVRPKKIDWPETEILLDMLAKSNYTQVGKKLGVSDNAIRKHLERVTIA